MNLFSDKKNLFLKVVNVILLLWFIGALIVCYSSIVNLFLTSIQSYQEYKSYNCIIYDNSKDNNATPKYYSDCYQRYDAYKQSQRNQNLKNLFIALGNVIIVGSTIRFLNNKKED
jgi:hypothetical protein